MKNNHRMVYLVLCGALAFAGVGCEDDDSKEPDTSEDAGPDGDDDDDGDDVEAQPRGAAKRPSPGAQIDRMGRPAINTALNATFEADATVKDAAKDAYNKAAPAAWSSFEGEMKKNLAILDSLDTVCGNQLLAGAGAGRYSTLASVLANDQIFVNTGSGTCGVYLGLEGEFVGALKAGEGGCGGRTPQDDVIDRSYSVLAAGILTGVDDTITKDDADHDIATFPWLAAPKN